MSKLTKAQLVAEIEALRSQLNTQHEINRRHVTDIATARALIANAQPSPNLIHGKAISNMPAWQLDRAAAMAVAKAKAMQSGTHVMVQS